MVVSRNLRQIAAFARQVLDLILTHSESRATPMLLLALETTCDETAAAIIDGELNVHASVVASQDDLHRRFGGVVPEIASRAHVERILPVIDETLRRAKISLDDLDAVAIATSPGLAGSLLVGLVAAKTLCVTHDLPLVAVDHLHAHIYACRMAAGEDIFPCVGLVVSGGHSQSLPLQQPTRLCDCWVARLTMRRARRSTKWPSLLGLAYPGGPAISAAAGEGDPTKFRFPRPLLEDDQRIDFSFSGLKTAVRYALAKPGEGGVDPRELGPQTVADVAASFQAAVVDCLVGKAELAIAQTGLPRLCVGGGVAANTLLRERFRKSAMRQGYTLHLAPADLCTDNAAMGAIAVERLRRASWSGSISTSRRGLSAEHTPIAACDPWGSRLMRGL